MKVIAKLKDGSTREVVIADNIARNLENQMDAIRIAKNRLHPDELAEVETFVIEEEFL